MKRILTLKLAEVTDYNDAQIECLKQFALAAMNAVQRQEARFHVLTTDDAETQQYCPHVVEIVALDEEDK